jgi:hypothetical protein
MDNFYPFIENNSKDDENHHEELPEPMYPARIAVYDDPTVPPRVVVVEPKDIRSYLQEIQDTVYELMMQQGGSFGYSTVRELVENYIHAYFIEPTISILDKGQTLIFSDQGPGIPNKEAAIKPSFTSATREMKKYIRGVGSGFPTVEQNIHARGGTITIEDNIGHGTVVTISLAHASNGQDAQQSLPGQDAQLQAGTHASTAAQTSQAPTVGGYWAQQSTSQYASANQYSQGYGYPSSASGAAAPAPTPVPASAQGYAQPYQPGYAPAYQPAYQQGYQAPNQQQYPYYQGAYPAMNPNANPNAGFAVQSPNAYLGMAGQPAFQQNASPAYGSQGYQGYPTLMGGTLNGAGASGVGGTGGLNKDLLAILQLFRDSQQIGTTDVNRRLNISLSTGTRRLQDLCKLGYIFKPNNNKKYQLTNKGIQFLNTI